MLSWDVSVHVENIKCFYVFYFILTQRNKSLHCSMNCSESNWKRIIFVQAKFNNSKFFSFFVIWIILNIGKK